MPCLDEIVPPWLVKQLSLSKRGWILVFEEFGGVAGTPPKNSRGRKKIPDLWIAVPVIRFLVVYTLKIAQPLHWHFLQAASNKTAIGTFTLFTVVDSNRNSHHPIQVPTDSRHNAQVKTRQSLPPYPGVQEDTRAKRQAL